MILRNILFQGPSRVMVRSSMSDRKTSLTEREKKWLLKSFCLNGENMCNIAIVERQKVMENHALFKLSISYFFLIGKIALLKNGSGIL
jgi:hypothetical protein